MLTTSQRLLTRILWGVAWGLLLQAAVSWCLHLGPGTQEHPIAAQIEPHG